MPEPVSAVEAINLVNAKAFKIRESTASISDLSRLQDEMVDLELAAEKAIAESGMSAEAQEEFVSKLTQIGEVGDEVVRLGSELKVRAETTKRKILKI